LAHRADTLSQPGPSPPRSPGWFELGPILALLELAWFAWFLVVPLPNIENLGHRISRWIFLAQALPHVWPGVTFYQSHLGGALRELGHFENLPQRLPIVLGAGVIAASAIALGQLVLRALGLRGALEARERLPLAFLLGTSGLGVATLLIGRLGWLGPWPIRVGLGVPIVLEAACLLRDRRAVVSSSTPRGGNDRRGPASPAALPALGPRLGFGLIAAPFLLVMALGAMLPTVDYDATEYHLQGPKEYYQAGRIAFLPHNVYTSMPFGVEMLHLLGMEVLDDWWWGALVGQLLVACFVPAATSFIALTAGRWGSPRAAWFGAIVYLTTPWVYRLAELPYVEGPLCAYHAALIWALGRAWAAEGRLRVRLWGVVGLLAGGAMACKYPALISAVLPFGLLALIEASRRRSATIVLAYVIGWGVVMTPWLARNVIDTGNPVYPLGYGVFGGRDWDAAREAQWVGAHGPRPITAAALGNSLLDVAGRSDWQSSLFAALAPLALLRREGRRLAWLLWGYVAYLFLTWWLLTHRLDRFWLPLLPALAILAGLGADWTRDRAWSLLLGALLAGAIAFNFTFISSGVVGLNEWTSDLRALRTRVPRLINPALARLDATLPRDARVLLVGQAGVFHMNHPVVYNTVFNRETFETMARGKTAPEVARELRVKGITHVYVDWFEIERYRSPGNYGFTPFVTPAVFARLVADGVLEPPRALGLRQELYRVRTTRSGVASRRRLWLAR
jgi:hypothetical protein